MTRTARLLLLGLVCGAVSCEPAVSVRPISEPGSCVSDPRVEGEWISVADGEDVDPNHYSRWVVASQSAQYGVEVHTSGEEREQAVTRYDVCLVALDDALFFDATFEDASDSGISRDRLPLGAAPVHVIGRLLIEPQLLVVRLLDSDWVEENTPGGVRELIRNGSSTYAVLTGSQTELQEVLTQQKDNSEAFALTQYLCRPDIDCPAQMYEYLLRNMTSERSPEWEDLLEQASTYYLRTGNYARATELLRRNSDLEPDDTSRRKQLGTALLFMRDYDGARREFSRAHHVQPDDEEAARGIGWSYFLQGRFEQAADALQGTATSALSTSADPVLLAYVALRRAGETDRAAVLLDEALRTFEGRVEDHLLLLLFAGRIERYPPELTDKAETRSRVGFFSAQRLLADGNPDAARSHLWECVTQGGRDDIYAIAARIELERLSVRSSHDDP